MDTHEDCNKHGPDFGEDAQRPVEALVSVRFTSVKTGLPEEMPSVDDCRYFLFVEDGIPYCGYYLKDGIFEDTTGRTRRNVEAWAEWREAMPEAH